MTQLFHKLYSSDRTRAKNLALAKNYFARARLNAQEKNYPLLEQKNFLLEQLELKKKISLKICFLMKFIDGLINFNGNLTFH